MSETTPPPTEMDTAASASELISEKPPAKPTETAKVSGIRPPSTATKSRIGRPCMHSAQKAPLPPQQQQSKFFFTYTIFIANKLYLSTYAS